MEEWQNQDADTLRDLGMAGGNRYRQAVRFVRAMAFMSDHEYRAMIAEVESRTQSRYPRELIVQAINMAPACTIGQTMSNLVNSAARVFESILHSESRQIVAEVRAI